MNYWSPRDLTKSMMTAAWAVSTAAMQQGLCLVMDSDDASAVATAMYRAGDNLQRGVVDLVFSGALRNMLDGVSGATTSGARDCAPSGRAPANRNEPVSL